MRASASTAARRLEVPHLLAVCGLDLGWDEARYTRTASSRHRGLDLAGPADLLAPTRPWPGRARRAVAARLAPRRGRDEQLAPGSSTQPLGPASGGTARTEAGAGADRARRNNARAGPRLPRVVPVLGAAGADWPWISIPARQTSQEPPLATANPELARRPTRPTGCNILVGAPVLDDERWEQRRTRGEYRAFDPAGSGRRRPRPCARRARRVLHARHRALSISDFLRAVPAPRWTGSMSTGPRRSARVRENHGRCTSRRTITSSSRARCAGASATTAAHRAHAVQTFLARPCSDAVLAASSRSCIPAALDAGDHTSYAMLGGCGVSLIAGNSAGPAVSRASAPPRSAPDSVSAHPSWKSAALCACSAYLHPSGPVGALGAPGAGRECGRRRQ